jgi:hypothetical protein
MLEEGHQQSNDMMAADDDFILASFDDLSDVLPNILGFLSLKDIMRSRRINKNTMNAVRNTIVPPCDFCINSLGNYNAMTVMTEAMPNLQQITIGGSGDGHKYSDGEDPDEEYAVITDDWISHDIEMISNFRQLRILTIWQADLNGRYPFLLNFPLLQKLTIMGSIFLKWDLDMLAGFPLLKELDCWGNPDMNGNINSLRVLKDTLEKVNICDCGIVEGNFMDLADFPHLKELYVCDTAVTGDIRDIGDNDFPSLESLILPNTVYGALGSTLRSISEGTDLIRTLYLLKKQRPALIADDWYGVLSMNSPDWYESADEHEETPPFKIYFVQAGSRIGYRWVGKYPWNTPCEVNWLDPEPDRESGDYEKYTEELQQIESEVSFYKGFHQPPTEEEYRERIFRRYT